MSGVKRTTSDIRGPRMSDEYSARVCHTNHPHGLSLRIGLCEVKMRRVLIFMVVVVSVVVQSNAVELLKRICQLAHRRGETRV